jgi:hypothetical protein
MRGFLLGLTVSIAFVAGCMASRLLVPPANAQANLTWWDHYCYREGDTTDALGVAARKAGAQGWELVTVVAADSESRRLWCFKRPSASPPR